MPHTSTIIATDILERRQRERGAEQASAVSYSKDPKSAACNFRARRTHACRDSSGPIVQISFGALLMATKLSVFVAGARNLVGVSAAAVSLSGASHARSAGSPGFPALGKQGWHERSVCGCQDPQCRLQETSRRESDESHQARSEPAMERGLVVLVGVNRSLPRSRVGDHAVRLGKDWQA